MPSTGFPQRSYCIPNIRAERRSILSKIDSVVATPTEKGTLEKGKKPRCVLGHIDQRRLVVTSHRPVANGRRGHGEVVGCFRDRLCEELSRIVSPRSKSGHRTFSRIVNGKRKPDISGNRQSNTSGCWTRLWVTGPQQPPTTCSPRCAAANRVEEAWRSDEGRSGWRWQSILTVDNIVECDDVFVDPEVDDRNCERHAGGARGQGRARQSRPVRGHLYLRLWPDRRAVDPARLHLRLGPRDAETRRKQIPDQHARALQDRRHGDDRRRLPALGISPSAWRRARGRGSARARCG